MTGKFIVLEGIDGSGKSTQVVRVVEALRRSGEQAVLMREPSDGPVGQVLRGYLDGAVISPARRGAIMALLFAADRLEHAQRDIEEPLANGYHVIGDRYVMSSVLYQARDSNFDLTEEWLERINRLARKPDLYVVLHVDPEDALRRIENRPGKKAIYENPELLKRLSLAYRNIRGDRIVHVNAAGSEDEVTERIFAVLQPIGISR